METKTEGKMFVVVVGAPLAPFRKIFGPFDTAQAAKEWAEAHESRRPVDLYARVQPILTAYESEFES